MCGTVPPCVMGLSAATRRIALPGRLPRAALPRPGGPVRRRFHRRRPVLRAVGVPGHHRDHRGDRRARPVLVGWVLRTPCTPPAACCGARDCRHLPDPAAGRHRAHQARHGAGRTGRAALRRELAVHPRGQRLLRQRHQWFAVPALLVALDRGTVLHRLSADRLPGAGPAALVEAATDAPARRARSPLHRLAGRRGRERRQLCLLRHPDPDLPAAGRLRARAADVGADPSAGRQPHSGPAGGCTGPLGRRTRPARGARCRSCSRPTWSTSARACAAC